MKNIKFTFDEIIKATEAQVLQCQNTSGMFSVSTDSREVNGNNVYLPLKGERFDGHNFIKSAVDKGARGYFTSDKTIIAPEAKFILYVEDTLETYLKIAAFYKSKIAPITIAVTGSSGKTTTKEMMASVLAEGYRIHKSILNHNNEVGLCQTMLSMPEDTEILIVEMGMRGLGEIELLSKYAKPDIAVIANTGSAHIGRLGTVRNIAKAKCEIAKYLHEEGVLYAHDTELIRKTNSYMGQTVYLGLNDTKLENIELKESSSEFVYKKHKYKLNVEGAHNIQNALFVINAALKLGMQPSQIAVGLEKYKPIEKRWEVDEIAGYKIINDSYNSNPESLKAAISTFLTTQKAPRALVIGDMAELGAKERAYHKEIGLFLNDYTEMADVEVITVGALSKLIAKNTKFKAVNFTDNKDAAKYILENIPVGTTMLFKASRSMKFEDIIKELDKE